MSAPPRAALIFSAHWDSPVQCVSHDALHETMHDYYGFPEEMYHIRYPVKGDPELSEWIGSIFRAGNLPYQVSRGRGLDHGAWVVLRTLFPNADIPAVALSVDSKRSPAEQYAIGKMLTELRERNVLIIGSGGLVHNLRLMENREDAAPWGAEFDEWISEQLTGWNLRTLFDYERKAPHAKEAVPSYATEHFAPLLYAMGASDHDRHASRLFQDYQYGSLSLNAWQFGS
ncbi:LigB family dioxygenase [compost metagenome]